MRTQGYQGTTGRGSALALVVLAHVLLLIWMQAARTVRVTESGEQWMELVAPARPVRALSEPVVPAQAGTHAELMDRRRMDTSRSRPGLPATAGRRPKSSSMSDESRTRDELAPAQEAHAPLPAGPQSAPSSEAQAGGLPATSTGTAAAVSTLAARALSAASAADRAERGGKPAALSAPLSAAPTPRQKLAAAIDAATAAPKAWQAPRITSLQDTNGYGRRIYKVETALSTYCIIVESNHALDGRDLRDGIKQKVVTCPIEF